VVRRGRHEPVTGSESGIAASPIRVASPALLPYAVVGPYSMNVLARPIGVTDPASVTLVALTADASPVAAPGAVASYAPLSHDAPAVRATPRWSVCRQVCTEGSIAGLPAAGARTGASARL
jgi:hypothetical protein